MNNLIKQCTKRPVTVEYITFDDLLEYVRHDYTENELNLVDGIPWSFSFKGHFISHETDTCYSIPTLEGTYSFTPDDVLIIGIDDEIYPCKKDIFELTYIY